MKNSTRLFVFLLMLSGSVLTAHESKSQRVNVNLSVFRTELGRHGRWMMHPQFGEVWSYNEPGFRPYYSNGYWDYGPEGWEWMSDYEWGWAAFHYGRWELDNYYGWLWIPGYEWAPAWVSWSEGGEYYGWAPMGIGIGVNIGIGAIQENRWVFCPRNRIYGRGFVNYCAPYNQYKRILPAISFINIYGGRNRNYWVGPERREVERYYGRRIEQRNYEGGYNNRNNGNGQSRPFINRPYSSNDRSVQQPNPSIGGNNDRNNSERRYDQRDVDYGRQPGQGRTVAPRVERNPSTNRSSERPVQRREIIERPKRTRD
jgi:hypothetical protein